MMNSNLKISLRFFPAKREEARPSFATRERNFTRVDVLFCDGEEKRERE